MLLFAGVGCAAAATAMAARGSIGK